MNHYFTTSFIHTPKFLPNHPMQNFHRLRRFDSTCSLILARRQSIRSMRLHLFLLFEPIVACTKKNQQFIPYRNASLLPDNFLIKESPKLTEFSGTYYYSVIKGSCFSPKYNARPPKMPGRPFIKCFEHGTILFPLLSREYTVEIKYTYFIRNLFAEKGIPTAFCL